MAFNFSPEQREAGKKNFEEVADGLTRRDFMKSLAIAGGTIVPVSAAVYFGYHSEKLGDKGPVRAALIGAGDEGGVLIGAHNPEYIKFVALADIRPSNRTRIFTGEPTGPRLGFEKIPAYGRDARKMIEVFETIDKLLAEKDRLKLEAVVIALPLHLHAPVAMQCMKAGLNVLCEKLMAWNIKQCKDMIKVANETDRVLSIGHQRHYSMLYAHATELIKADTFGDIKHIRALWHRNNALPRVDKDGKEIVPRTLRDSWKPDLKEEDVKALQERVTKEFGYKSMEELVRWRLYNRTGGGLMAELGSHQLDACSIFLQAQAASVMKDKAPYKVYPLAVTGVGGKYFYRDDREVDDHVFVTFEFPGPNYWADKEQTQLKDKNDIVVVTYSSISTNGFEPYGEYIMGSKGSMQVEMEQALMIWPERGINLAAKPTGATVANAAGGKPVIDSGPSGPPTAASSSAAKAAAGGPEPVSRGYREEMEHFAYCIRMREQMSKEDKDRPKPRCDGPAAMVDAIIALTSNRAIREQRRIEFDRKWFDPESAETPDDKKYEDKVNGAVAAE